jgi:hypothetical protein
MLAIALAVFIVLMVVVDRWDDESFADVISQSICSSTYLQPVHGF